VSGPGWAVGHGDLHCVDRVMQGRYQTGAAIEDGDGVRSAVDIMVGKCSARRDISPRCRPLVTWQKMPCPAVCRVRARAASPLPCSRGTLEGCEVRLGLDLLRKTPEFVAEVSNTKALDGDFHGDATAHWHNIYGGPGTTPTGSRGAQHRVPAPPRVTCPQARERQLLRPPAAPNFARPPPSQMSTMRG